MGVDFRRANLFAPGKLEEHLLQREPQVPSSQLTGDTRPRGHAGLCLAALEGWGLRKEVGKCQVPCMGVGAPAGASRLPGDPGDLGGRVCNPCLPPSAPSG